MKMSSTAEAQEPAIATPDALVASTRETVIIETRFGEMSFDRDDTIYLPRGLFGYADYHDFGLANLSDPRLEQFKLMQSLTEPSLSFIVAPLNAESDIIDAADIDAAGDVLSIARADTAVLLIVATRKVGAESQISVNLRAPIIVDTKSQTGWQYVLNNSRYPVRHVLMQGVKEADQAAVK